MRIGDMPMRMPTVSFWLAKGSPAHTPADNPDQTCDTLSKVHLSRNLKVISYLIFTLASGGFALLLVLRTPIDWQVYLHSGQKILQLDDQLYQQPYGELPFTYPPFAAIVFTPLAILPRSLSILSHYTLSLLSLYILIRDSFHPRSSRHFLLFTTAIALLLEPMSSNMSFGQINLTLAMFVVLDLTNADRTHSGILIGLAVAVKLTPVAFLVIPLFRRDFAQIARAFATFAACTAMGWAVAPNSSYSYWLGGTLSPERIGGASYAGNQSLNGMIWRVIGPGGSFPVWLALSMTVGLVALAGLLRVSHQGFGHTKASLAIVSLTVLLLSPISWNHHWIWIMYPLALLWQSRKDSPSRAVSYLSYSLCCSWMIVLVGRTIWWWGSGNDTEYVQGTLVKALQSSYVALGFASLVLISALSFKGFFASLKVQQRTVAPSTPDGSSQA